MPKLNQIIAVEKGVKARSEQELTKAHQALLKPVLLTGISRTYQPKDDEGDTFPPESTRVQLNAEDAIKQTAEIMTRLFDVTAVKEWANTQARADVIVDGQTILGNVPVTYLLFLEKQLINLRTFVAKLPVLDQANTWTQDAGSGVWATDPTSTVKTKKVPRNHVKAEATDKHPAQVEVYHEDVVQGTWRTIHFSGALPAARVRQLLDRVETFQEAVKCARETANSIEATDVTTGAAVFNYLFAA